jgi:hypothetical protein
MKSGLEIIDKQREIARSRLESVMLRKALEMAVDLKLRQLQNEADIRRDRSSSSSLVTEIYASSSSNALASWRSAVSKPSVNHA